MIPSFPADFKDIILDTSIRNGNEIEWFRVLDKAIKTSISFERNILLSALTQSRNEKLIKM
jgi:hypothetical protein